MERFFQNDGWVKILSGLLAVLLWVTVSTQQGQQEEVVFESAPLRVYPAPPEFVVLDGPRQGELTVRITAKGSRLQISRIDRNRLEAFVDYSLIARSGAREAVINVQAIEGAQLPAGVQFVAEPARIPVQIARSVEKPMAVRLFPSPGELIIDGRDARYTATARPNLLVISGPEEYVNRVTQLQVNLRDSDVQQAGMITKQPLAVDDRNNIVPYVRVPSVDVEIAILILPPAKTVLVRPAVKGALPEGYQYSVAVDPQLVKIRGDVPLTGIEEVRTEPIDLTGKTRNFETTVKVLPPAGTTVEQETVAVAVTVSEVAEERSFPGVKLQVFGLATNAQVLTMPPEVTVRLQGYRRLLNEVRAEDLVAFIDLEGVVGDRQTLPVRLRPPGPGLDLVRIDPPAVEALVELKE
jgi:YbbR domain-containing protein